MLAALDDVVRSATSALAAYDHTGALEATERFFWMFCDDYLELVKARAYGSGAGAASARGALRAALSVLLRLFAPFLPFVTEEVWSWWQEGSVHRAAWPAASAATGLVGAGVGGGWAPTAIASVLATAAAVLGQIRKAKSEAKVSMRAEAARVIVRGPSADAGRRRAAERGRPAGGREHRRLLVRRWCPGRRAGDRGHAGGSGYLLSRGSGPVGSRGIGRVVDCSLGSEPVAGPKRSTARSPTSW